MLFPDVTAAASRLCLACGMCCNGVLFHIVRLQQVDSVKRLESLGLKINRKKKEPYFNQPCRFLEDCTCQIYNDRPSRCRLFECQQIKKLSSEETSENQALEIIALAKSKVARVEHLLHECGNETHGRPLLERCQEGVTKTGGVAKRELCEAAQELHDFLNVHFRIEPTELTLG
ncbi:YkgJ family cysteine cluster protein [Prosthecobacter dejongeii]|uniref:Uncharacterized protein n=1 Tax=Prosthecobacter dejongeii TaxID=48465 RepID=A0A7W7YJ68_9BACT|nr:YkgJ family cysteine cluster protein [Prosthecobacter dejongeii]MBB5036855.1 hypothetical protein [Prosthecobacter dejongeii]